MKDEQHNIITIFTDDDYHDDDSDADVKVEANS